ncbi:flagellar hook-length control protein FliK [Butyribacter sp.]|uniref:flagellar hook-length control protein FliK n=1 Tax=Butyribacter sp. TaxID=2822465 RepID=UPI002A995064|nr:flagellar hook-length control protein FliK [Butyribacter sp.]
MAEIKSVIMETLSAGQVKQQAKGSVQKNSSSNSFDNYLSTSQKSNGAAASKTASKTQSNNVKVANQSKAKSTSDKVSDVNSGNSVNSLNQKSIDKVNEKIADEVKDVLGIDDDTFANAMTALGLSPLDLLESNNLAKLVLFVNGSSDFTDLLTDENMMNQLNELSDILGNLNWEDLTGMSKSDFLEGVEYFNAKSQTGSDVFKEDAPALAQETAVDAADSGNTSENVSAEEESATNTNNVSTEKKSVQGETTVNTSDNSSDTKVEVSVTKSEESSLQQSSSSSQSEDDMSEVTHDQTISEDDVTTDNQHTVRNDFIQNLNQAVNDAVQVAKPESVRMQQMVDIVNQVVERIKVSIGTESTSMEMQLNPEHLGKLLLNVSSKNGVMTAVFSVQSEEAKAALESQMYTLRENLELRELKVDAVEVNVSDFDFSHSDQTMSGDQSKADNGNGKQMKFDFDDEASSEEMISNEEKEAVRKQVMRDNGSQIDFTA